MTSLLIRNSSTATTGCVLIDRQLISQAESSVATFSRSNTLENARENAREDTTEEKI